MLWYCHKRGREVRLEREASEASSGRVEELPDDPALLAAPPASNASTGRRTPILMESRSEVTSPGPGLAPLAQGGRASGRQSPVAVANAARK